MGGNQCSCFGLRVARGAGGRGTVGFVITSRVHVSHASEGRLRTVSCEPDIGGRE